MSHTLPEGHILLEQYKIIRVLGKGGFGITYLATDTRIEHKVAIKQYLPTECYQSFKTSFLEEAKTLAKFRNNGIIRVLNYFEADETAYLVMEYEEGKDLRQYLIDRGATLTEPGIISLMMPVLTGLETLHQANLIHRDIKPSNIYVRQDGSAVLLDFGAARQVIQDHTKDMTALITPGYAPVEQYTSNASEQGPWSDVYAMAAVLYEIVSGKKPIDANTRAQALLARHPDPLPAAIIVGHGRFTPLFLAAIDAGLIVLSQNRPQSIAKWQQALTRSQQDHTDTQLQQLERENQRLHAQLENDTQRVAITKPKESVGLGRWMAGFAFVIGIVIATYVGMQTETYHLTIRANVDASNVLLNGASVGPTPLEVDLKAGQYTIAFNKPGFESDIIDIRFNRDRTITGRLSVKLEQDQTVADLAPAPVLVEDKLDQDQDQAIIDPVAITQDQEPVVIDPVAANLEQSLEQDDIRPTVTDTEKANLEQQQTVADRAKNSDQQVPVSENTINKIDRVQYEVVIDQHGDHVVREKSNDTLQSRFPALEAIAQTDPTPNTASVERQEDAVVHGKMTKIDETDWQDPATGMVFVWVPKGCFQMGSNKGEDDEKPMHEVCVEGFWIGKYEVNVKQWRQFVRKTEYSGDETKNYRKCQAMAQTKSFTQSDEESVACVSWRESMALVQWLSQRSGKRYRLPSEAQWEYACRSGGKANYSEDDSLGNMAWYAENSEKKTHPVGKKTANEFGIHDMRGNVWEWVTDIYSADAYNNHALNNPINAENGQNRVDRGGGWGDSAAFTRCAIRGYDSPGYRSESLGLRLLIEGKPEGAF